MADSLRSLESEVERIQQETERARKKAEHAREEAEHAREEAKRTRAQAPRARQEAIYATLKSRGAIAALLFSARTYYGPTAYPRKTINNTAEPENGAKAGLPDELEMALADRVEFGSRIIHQLPSAAAPLRAVLMPSIRAAVALLAENGSPITQVKMMRACNNIPELDFIETLRTPLNSKIDWVRNQALVLISSRSGARAVGSDLATEMGYDLANGLFSRRFFAYCTAAARAPQPSYWWSLIVGALCSLANIVCLLLFAAGVLFGAWSLRSVYIEGATLQRIDHNIQSNLGVRGGKWSYTEKSVPLPVQKWLRALGLPTPSHQSPSPSLQSVDLRGFSVLGHHVSIVVASLVLLAVTIAALTLQPPLLWIAILAAAVVLGIFIPLFVDLWTGTFAIMFAMFLGLISGLPFLAIGIASMALAANHFTWLAMYLVSTAWVRGGGHSATTFFRAGWRSCRFSTGWILGAAGLALSVGVLLMSVTVFAIMRVIELISDLSFLPYHPSVNLLITGLAVLSAGTLLRCLRRSTPIPALYFAAYLAIAFILLLGIPLMISGVFVIVPLIAPIVEWLKRFTFWFELFRVLLAIVSLLVLWPLFRVAVSTLWRLIVRLVLGVAEKFPPGSFDPKDWKSRIDAANARAQASLLSRTDHQSLSVTPSNFLGILKDVRPNIREEPALSAYWDIRDRVEQVLRQERSG
jgi:hypothetical protein